MIPVGTAQVGCDTDDIVGAVGVPSALFITTGLLARGVIQVLSVVLLTDMIYAAGAREAKVAEAPYTPLIPYSTLA
jgi:hypothetical protein